MDRSLSDDGRPERSPHESALAERLTRAMLEEDVNLAERLGRDPSAHLDLIRLAARAEELTGDLLKGAVLGARSAGNTWEVIGQVLGMSRQAAQQRFGTAVSRRSASAGSPARTSGASSTAAVTEA